MVAFPITEAQLIELFVGAVLFGLHMTSTGSCIYTLVSQKKPNTSRTVALSLILLINAAFDVSLQFYDILQAFVFYNGPGGAADEFEHASSWLNISKVPRNMLDFD